MKTFKFRIWDKDTLENLTSYCSILAENGNIACIHKKYNKLSSEECKDQFIVEQFTGLLDKSGVKIYKGDIIDVCPDGKQEYLRVVEWDDELAQFRALFPDGSGQLFTKRQCLTYEVIGNIHQHPDLLETK